MDFGDDLGEESSEMSDADPAELLNNMKGIDELEAELFGPSTVSTDKQSPSRAKETPKKRVSFQDPIDTSKSSPKKGLEKEKDKFDFNPDDPLGGLLSDDDGNDDILAPSGGGKPKLKSEKSKKDSADDWLFADDDADDLLGDDGPKRQQQARKQQKKEETRAKMSVESLMRPSSADDLLKKSSPGIKKMTLDDFATTAAKMSPEKSASPYTAVPASSSNGKKEISFDDEFGFGSYRPSLSSPADTKRKGRPRPTRSTGGDFFDFLKEDEGRKSPVENVLSPPSSQSKPAGSVPLPRPATVDIPASSSSGRSVSQEKGRPHTAEPIRVPAASTPAVQHQQRLSDSQATDVSQELQTGHTKHVTGTASLNSEFKTPPAADVILGQSQKLAESPFMQRHLPVIEKSSSSSALTPSRSERTAHKRGVNSLSESKVAKSLGEEAHLQSVETQLEHARALLHNVELGYKSDLELSKTTYDARIELLKTSFNDLKSRVDRELESVRESYSARINVLRNAMQTQVQADTSKECEHQEEIKRLRNLHLQALDECRMDADAQITRLRELHTTEIDAIKNSTYHARNIESMMVKVDDSTGKLQQLSSKYESAYRAMTQQSEAIALSNKQLISVVQNQLGQQQRSTSDAHIQMQQTASRLEGMVSEMNRKLEEQHYAMQLSHSNLQSAHAALQEERKQFMQQITLEREHLRKAHREMINLQSEMRQEAREDHSKLLRAADELSSISTRFEEARISEAEQTVRRNRDHEEAMSNINSEKIELARKRAQLESANEKLHSQKQELNSKLSQFNEEKVVLQQIQHELEQRQAEMDALSQKNIENEADKERAYTEAKGLEEDQSRKLAEIHNEMKELTKQRQLLAEERKALAQERSSGGMLAFSSPVSAPVSPAVDTLPKQSFVTPIKHRLMKSHPGSPGQTTSSGLILWQHSAKKDQSFLEDEQFFLETLKNSPYGKKS